MIAWFATKGSGTNEARRIETLLADHAPLVEIAFDKRRKRESFRHVVAELRRLRPRLVVMEGSGIAGGAACLWARWRWGIPFVLSSGDAIGPFIGSHRPGLGWLFGRYERLLYRWSAGLIGWTPYLVGRAMTFGAPRAMTAPGWSIGGATPTPGARERVRDALGIGRERIVFGLVGALEWNAAKGYAYGLELIRAIAKVDRPEVAVLIIGGGSGLDRLRAEAGPLLGQRVFLPGPVPLEEVADHLAAMDVASLPQTMDAVGMFRYTTKIAEYADARLPIVTGRLPVAYDLGGDAMWRLPGATPWGDRYVEALAGLMREVTPESLATRRAALPPPSTLFDAERQRAAVGAFIAELLEDLS